MLGYDFLVCFKHFKKYSKDFLHVKEINFHLFIEVINLADFLIIHLYFPKIKNYC